MRAQKWLNTGNCGEGAIPPPPNLARAAVATTCDGLFLETHLRPGEALSDRENALPFGALKALWRQVRAIDEIVRKPVKGAA